MCADGGANRLYDRGVALEAQHLVAPHYIKGDLDSLRADVREYFSAKGTQVLQDPDQNTNDLDKCLQLIHQLQEADDSSDRFSVMIFGAMGGRFDQEMQNVNALFRWKDKFQQMVMLSSETTARLLAPNEARDLAQLPLRDADVRTDPRGGGVQGGDDDGAEVESEPRHGDGL